MKSHQWKTSTNLTTLKQADIQTDNQTDNKDNQTALEINKTQEAKFRKKILELWKNYITTIEYFTGAHMVNYLLKI